MRQRTKKKRRAKFSGRKQSIRGLVGLILGIISVLSYLIMINISFVEEGNAHIMIGSVGVLSVIGAAVGTVFSFLSLKEEDIYKVVPIAGALLGVIGLFAGVGIYVLGILY